MGGGRTFVHFSYVLNCSFTESSCPRAAPRVSGPARRMRGRGAVGGTDGSKVRSMMGRKGVGGERGTSMRWSTIRYLRTPPET